jgi:hypothetical protein
MAMRGLADIDKRAAVYPQKKHSAMDLFAFRRLALTTLIQCQKSESGFVFLATASVRIYDHKIRRLLFGFKIALRIAVDILSISGGFSRLWKAAVGQQFKGFAFTQI